MMALALTLTEVRVTRAEISFEWVTVGNPGNPNDPLSDVPTGGVTPPERGAVAYVYSISKYETTLGQWASFLNAVAESNPERARSLYSSQLAELRSVSGIARLTIEGKDVFRLMHGGGPIAYLPVTFVDYLDAVRFVNWLHNGQGAGIPRLAPTP
jgi:formylglycine-generating enzyme